MPAAVSRTKQGSTGSILRFPVVIHYFVRAYLLLALTGFLSSTYAQELDSDPGLEEAEQDAVGRIIAQAEEQQQNDANQQAITPINRNLEGFADTTWQTTYEEVFQKMKNLSASEAAAESVEIVNAEPKKSLLVKRNGILYRYNFYRTPLTVVRLTEHDITEEEYDRRDAVLFHVKVMPPLIESELIYEKIKKAYGEKTRSTVDEQNKGVNIWELNNGLIFQWYEPYRGKPYTRSIDYMSSDIARRILEEYEDYFDSKEKKLLQDMIVN